MSGREGEPEDRESTFGEQRAGGLGLEAAGGEAGSFGVEAAGGRKGGPEKTAGGKKGCFGARAAGRTSEKGPRRKRPAVNAKETGTGGGKLRRGDVEINGLRPNSKIESR